MASTSCTSLDFMVSWIEVSSNACFVCCNFIVDFLIEKYIFMIRSGRMHRKLQLSYFCRSFIKRKSSFSTKTICCSTATTLFKTQMILRTMLVYFCALSSSAISVNSHLTELFSIYKHHKILCDNYNVYLNTVFVKITIVEIEE